MLTVLLSCTLRKHTTPPSTTIGTIWAYLEYIVGMHVAPQD
jgi:hypothetical protein